MMRPAGKNHNRTSKPFGRHRTSVESPPVDKLLYEKELRYFQQPCSNSPDRMENPDHSAGQMTQDSEEFSAGALTDKDRLAQALNKMILDGEARGDTKLFSDLKKFLGSRNINLDSEELDEVPQVSDEFSSLQHNQVSSATSSTTEAETVKPNSPVAFINQEYPFQEGRMNIADFQQFSGMGIPTQQCPNSHICHELADQLLKDDQNLVKSDYLILHIEDNDQNVTSVHESFTETEVTEVKPLKSLEDSETLMNDERESRASSTSDYEIDLVKDHSLHIQSPCEGDLILAEKVTLKDQSDMSILVDAAEVLKHLNERDASLYDQVYISNDPSISLVASIPSQTSCQKIQDIVLENEAKSESKSNDQDSLSILHTVSNEECNEFSGRGENFSNNLCEDDSKMEDNGNAKSEAIVDEEYNAGHAFQDSRQMAQSDSNNDDDLPPKIINSNDNLCNFSETICIANVSTNSKLKSCESSESGSPDLDSKDDSLLKVEVKCESKSLSLVQNQENQHVAQTDDKNQFESTNAGKRIRNSSEIHKSNADENVIDKLHGLRWLKSPESSSDADMTRKKPKKKGSPPVEESSDNVDKSNQAPQASKTNGATQQNNSRRQSTPGPLQLSTNTEPLSVWSSPNAAQQLFPKPQTPPLEKLKEEEEYNLACAESISTYEKEIELRKMAGVFPKTQTLDNANQDKSNKILQDIPDYLRREPRHGDSNNNESKTNSESDKSSHSLDKRPVIGRGPKADQEFPSLPPKGNNSSRNKSNVTKKNHPSNNRNGSLQQPPHDGNIHQTSTSVVSDNDAHADHDQSHSKPLLSHPGQRIPTTEQVRHQTDQSQNQDHGKNFDEHPYRNMEVLNNTKINTSGQCGPRVNNNSSSYHVSNASVNSQYQEQSHQKPNDDRNYNYNYSNRKQDFSYDGDSKNYDHQKKDRRCQTSEDQSTRARTQNPHGNVSDRFRNQNITSREDYHESRGPIDQNRQEYYAKNRDNPANFDLPYMNQNLTTKNNYSNRNQAYNSRENEHPYRNQDRRDSWGSDRNRGNNNYSNDYDSNSEYPIKNQRFQNSRSQNSFQKTHDNRSQEHPNPKHNYTSNKHQAWTSEIKNQNNNSLEENWDDDVDIPRSQRSSDPKTQQVCNLVKIQSASSSENVITENSKEKSQLLSQNQKSEMHDGRRPMSVSSLSESTLGKPQEPEKFTKTSPVSDSHSKEMKNSGKAGVSIGDFNITSIQNHGVRADDVEANIPTSPQYLPPGLYHQIAMSRPGPCSNPLFLPGHSVMNVNPQPFEIARATHGLDLNSPQVAAMGSPVVPVNPCILPTSDIVNPQHMNELSHNSQEIMRLHNKVDKLSKELQTAQAELLAAQAKSFHHVYVMNPALQNLMVNQDRLPSTSSNPPHALSDPMSGKSTVPPNLSALNPNLQNLNPVTSVDPTIMTRLHLQSLYMQQGNFHVTQSAAHFSPNSADCNLNSIVMGRTQPQSNEVREIRKHSAKHDQ